MIRELPISDIDLRADARAVDEAAVAALSESIAAVGLINPIRVRAAGSRWEVIAGAHRLAACMALGLADIQAVVATDDDLHAELAMIDENLCRAELSPSDRARQTARRKAIYLELHPETAAHVAGAHGSNAVQGNASANLAPAFTAATAKVTGQSERAVQRDAERGEKVIPEVLDMVRGTALDTGTYLDKIKRLSPNDQVAAARRDIAHQRQMERERQSGIARRIVKIADEPLNDLEAKEKQVAALMAAWNKASKEAREEFLARIDTPVFDNTRAA